MTLTNYAYVPFSVNLEYRQLKGLFWLPPKPARLPAALLAPRVDMPGADIIPGRCRELPPLTPPAVAHRQ